MRAVLAIVMILSTTLVGPATAQKAVPTPPGAVVPKPPKKWTTMVTVTEQVSSQCGGAAYRPELDERYAVVGATYLVRRGKLNTPSKVIAQATTDSDGHLYFNLPKGTYCLIKPDKKDLSAKTKTKPKPEALAPPAPPGPNSAGLVSNEGLTNEEKKYCDLVVVAPTKTATIGHFRSTCPPLPPGASPPP